MRDYNKKISWKPLFAVILAIACLLVCIMLSAVKPASAQDIQLYSDAESSVYGFNVDDENFDVKWTSSTQSVNYNGAYTGDVTFYLGGVRMKDKLTNGRYCYGVLVYAIVTPRDFTLTADGKSHTYRGRSRFLELQSSLSSNQTLLSSTPENVAGSSSYTVGINAGGGTSGIQGGISASTTITVNALKTFNYSDVQSGKFNVKYEYIRHIGPWEWERTKYCWYQSVQRAAFFFSSPNVVSSKTLTVKSTFAIDDGAIGMWNLEMGYEVTGTKILTVRF